MFPFSILKQYTNVPENELDVCRILKQDKSRISAMENAMDKALTEMRIDQKVKLKSLEESDNPLLKKRLDKTSKKSIEQNHQPNVPQKVSPLANTTNNHLNNGSQIDEESTML